jgi:hypothetical protein
MPRTKSNETNEAEATQARADYALAGRIVEPKAEKRAKIGSATGVVLSVDRSSRVVHYVVRMLDGKNAGAEKRVSANDYDVQAGSARIFNQTPTRSMTSDASDAPSASDVLSDETMTDAELADLDADDRAEYVEQMEREQAERDDVDDVRAYVDADGYSPTFDDDDERESDDPADDDVLRHLDRLDEAQASAATSTSLVKWCDACDAPLARFTDYVATDAGTFCDADCMLAHEALNLADAARSADVERAEVDAADERADDAAALAADEAAPTPTPVARPKVLRGRIVKSATSAPKVVDKPTTRTALQALLDAGAKVAGRTDWPGRVKRAGWTLDTIPADVLRKFKKSQGVHEVARVFTVDVESAARAVSKALGLDDAQTDKAVARALARPDVVTKHVGVKVTGKPNEHCGGCSNGECCGACSCCRVAARKANKANKANKAKRAATSDDAAPTRVRKSATQACPDVEPGRCVKLGDLVEGDAFVAGEVDEDGDRRWWGVVASVGVGSVTVEVRGGRAPIKGRDYVSASVEVRRTTRAAVIA